MKTIKLLSMDLFQNSTTDDRFYEEKTPRTVLDEKEMSQIIYPLLNELPKELRESFMVRAGIHPKYKSCEQLSVDLECTRQTIHARAKKVEKYLKKKLDELGVENVSLN